MLVATFFPICSGHVSPNLSRRATQTSRVMELRNASVYITGSGCSHLMPSSRLAFSTCRCFTCFFNEIYPCIVYASSFHITQYHQTLTMETHVVQWSHGQRKRKSTWLDGWMEDNLVNLWATKLPHVLGRVQRESEWRHAGIYLC